jgi:hypothetical protein
MSQKWRTNGALRCRRDYRKREKNVKKKSIGLLCCFVSLALFLILTAHIDTHAIDTPTTGDSLINYSGTG